MMNLLELVSDELYKGYFVDLYVRCANKVAIEMYEGMGYSVYRRVREYYGSLGNGRGGRDDEDAFGEWAGFFFFFERERGMRELMCTLYIFFLKI
jgi:ribosomal protein S18 acetylase RimI-like enzyme